MKKILITLCAILLAGTATLYAKEDPRKILDEAVNKLHTQGGVTAQFTITNFKGTKEIGSTQGHMTMLDQLYTLTTPEFVSWFDGETQWTLNKTSNEVNVTKPSTKELRKSSPAALMMAYKNGYRLSLKNTKLRGKDVWEITMDAINGNSRPERIQVSLGKDYTPMCLRVRNNGDWMRFTITQYIVGQTFDIKSFQFQKKDFPDVDVVDLR